MRAALCIMSCALLAHRFFVTVGLFHRLATSSEAVARSADDVAGAGETQVVWSDAAEGAGVAAEPAMLGEVGSSSEMISSDHACLPLAADLVSAETVGWCRERTLATAAALSRRGTDETTATGTLNIWPIFSL